jgi:2-methylcitrate dehydratase PrpD
LRRASLAEFADEVVTRADVQDAIAKINFEAYTDEEARINNYTRLTTFIDIVMRDGRTLSARVDEAKGAPAYPMNEQDVAEKFRECAQFAGWISDHSDRIIEQVLELEKLESVRKFGELMGVERSV